MQYIKYAQICVQRKGELKEPEEETQTKPKASRSKEVTDINKKEKKKIKKNQ